MRTKIVILSTIMAAFLLSACNPKGSDMLVAKYGENDITLSEFEKAYAKNAGGFEEAKDDSLAQMKKFLDLYVNFRMKLRDSQVRNYENDPELSNEIKDYKMKVGKTFLIEKELIEPNLKDLYEKRKEERRVAHIMIRVDSSEAAAKKQAEELIARIQKGESFEELASQYSADKFSKDNGGDIYWITAGVIIPEIENAAYNTKVGEIYPEPVKTRYGYHVIKVTDKQPRTPEIRASHILVGFAEKGETPDTAKAREKAEKIRQEIMNGMDFGEAAKKYSIDKGSAVNGGDLGFFQRRRMVKPFDEEAFSLKKGEVSDIVETNYGFHIIKVTDVKEYPSYEDEAKALHTIFEKIYMGKAKAAFADSLKNEFNYVLNQEVYNGLKAKTDTVKIPDYLKSPLKEEYNDKVLFTVGDSAFTVGQMIAEKKSEVKYRTRNLSEILDELLDDYSSDILLGKKAEVLDKSNPEFASLMEDYKNGIFIFKLQEEEVWNRIKVDSTELKEYYEQHKNEFTWSDRVKFSEIFIKNDSLASDYYAELKAGADFDSLAAKVTERSGYKNRKGNHGLTEVEGNELAVKAFSLDNEGDISEPFETENGWAIVRLNEKLPAGIKTFEEAKAEIASVLQELKSKELEDSYLDKLKERYEPQVYYENLSNAFKDENH